MTRIEINISNHVMHIYRQVASVFLNFLHNKKYHSYIIAHPDVGFCDWANGFGRRWHCVGGGVVIVWLGLGLYRRIVASHPDDMALDRQLGICASACRFCNSREPGATAKGRGGMCGKNCRGPVVVKGGTCNVMQQLWIVCKSSNLL